MNSSHFFFTLHRLPAKLGFRSKQFFQKGQILYAGMDMVFQEMHIADADVFIFSGGRQNLHESDRTRFVFFKKN